MSCQNSFILFNILIKRHRCHRVPFLLRIKYRDNTFPKSPTKVCEWINNIVIIRLFYLRLIQYDKQIPIAAFTIVTSSPGTIKQQSRILRKHVLCHLLNALNNFILAHNIRYLPQRYKLFSIPPNFSPIFLPKEKAATVICRCP